MTPQQEKEQAFQREVDRWKADLKFDPRCILIALNNMYPTLRASENHAPQFIAAVELCYEIVRAAGK